MKEIQILENGEKLYDIRRKINENFELVNEKTIGFTKFCVNSGNTENDSPDLLEYNDNMVSFKVGGQYPDVTATNGDNVTFTRNSISDVGVIGLEDGVYKIFIDDENAEIGTGEIYSQFTQPENMQDGDIWFNGITAQLYTKNENPLTFKNTGRSYQLNDIATNGSVYVACTANGKILVSTNNLQNWTEYSIHTGTDQLTAVTYVHSLFYTVSYEGTLYSSPDGINWTQQTQKLDAGVNKLKAVNNYLVAVSAIGKVSVMNQNKVWSYSVISGDAINLSDIVFDGTYYYLSGNRKIYRSTNLTTWVEFKSVEEANISCLYLSDNKLLCGGSPTHLYTHDFNTSAWASYDFNTAGTITGISKIGNEFFIVGTNNNTYRTTNLQNFEQLTTDTQNIVIFQSINQDIAVGSNGVIAQITSQTSLQPFNKVPVGEVVKSGGTIVEAITYPYNVNGLTMASTTNYGVMRVAAQTDETDCSCNDASITPSNLYSLANYRRANTEYQVNDTVACPYHHDLQLKCTVGGTTSGQALDVDNLQVDSTVEDGTVVWQVEQLGTGGGTTISGGFGYNLFDTILKDHILTYKETKGLALQGTYVYKEALAGSRYGYPDFYNKVVEEFNEATATETVNGVTVKVHSNGHKFYNIADKTAIDNYFNSMGSAWFYGVDTENERVFLPRNNWFEQATLNESEVGQSVEAGLPNIEGSIVAASSLNSDTGSGAFKFNTNLDAGLYSGGNHGNNLRTSFSASNSNPIYSNSDTVQPKSVKKLLYICVGNTTNYEGVTDVVNQGMDILEQVAQKVNIDGTNLNTEGKSLISSLAMPSGKFISLTLGASGTKYTAPANGYVCLSKVAGISNAYITIKAAGMEIIQNASTQYDTCAGFAPVGEGTTYTVSYTATGQTWAFRFVYAVGSESEAQ